MGRPAKWVVAVDWARWPASDCFGGGESVGGGVVCVGGFGGGEGEGFVGGAGDSVEEASVRLGDEAHEGAGIGGE